MVNPANDFVSDLVGAGDVLRRLSLLPVKAALQAADGRADDGPEVSVATDLRSALSMLLESESQRLPVVNDDGSPAGWVDLAAVHAVSMKAHEHDDAKVAS
jgi:osmoprotectant transport system ATP-binding protein